MTNPDEQEFVLEQSGRRLTQSKTDTTRSSVVPESLRILLNGLIDYAGLFPPAKLAMKPAIENYDTYLQSEYGWILRRLVIPAARIDEFELAFQQLPLMAQPAKSWRLTASVGPDIQSELGNILEFNRRHSHSSLNRVVMFESVEIKVGGAEDVHRASNLIPRELHSFFEIPISGEVKSSLAAIAEVSARAKVRTGGENPPMFPSSADLTNFLSLSAAARVPFKASAGLHRAVRGIQRYTYAADSPSGTMFGFLNVFLAAAFIFCGVKLKEAQRLLEEEEPQGFDFRDTDVGWGGNRIDNEQLAAARQSFCLSFGSCSFLEPIDSLKELGFL